MYRDYICDACGFNSEEQEGVYKCPKCGNQMRVAKTGRYGGDSTQSFGRWLIYALEFVILLPLCFVFLAGIPGIIVFIIIFLIIRKLLLTVSRNQAIKISPNVKNPNKIYKCSNCNQSFYGQQPICPKCGTTLKYND